MNRKRLLTLAGSVCLVLMLAALLLPGCAKPEAAAPSTAEEEELRARIAELEEELAGTVPAPEVFKWRFTDAYPAGSIMAIVNAELCEKLATTSDGRLQFEYYPAGELMPSGELADGVMTGVTEIQHNSGGYFAGVMGDVGHLESGIGTYMPHHDVWNMYHDNDHEILNIVRSVYAEYNLHYLHPVPHYPISDCIFSTIPLESPADLDGMPFRSSGMSAKILSKMGAATVWLPWEELYTALQTGTVTACEWAEPGTMWEMGIQEVCPYWYLPYFASGVISCIVVNKDAWETLPDGLKELIDITFSAEFTQVGARETLKDLYVLPLAEDAGVTISYWTDEELQMFIDAWAEVMTEMGTSGEPYCAELFNAVKAQRIFLGEWPGV